MSRRYYGPVYLVRRGGPSNPAARHEEVVDTYQDGRSHIDVTQELWTLAGDSARANAITAIVDRAFERDYPVLVDEDIREMLALVDGDRLEAALKRTVVDERGIIRPERMAEVRRHSQLLDLDEDRGDLAEVAVMEGLGRVSQLESILKDAHERCLDVALD